MASNRDKVTHVEYVSGGLLRVANKGVTGAVKGRVGNVLMPRGLERTTRRGYIRHAARKTAPSKSEPL